MIFLSKTLIAKTMAIQLTLFGWSWKLFSTGDITLTRSSSQIQSTEQKYDSAEMFGFTLNLRFPKNLQVRRAWTLSFRIKPARTRVKLEWFYLLTAGLKKPIRSWRGSVALPVWGSYRNKQKWISIHDAVYHSPKSQ